MNQMSLKACVYMKREHCIISLVKFILKIYIGTILIYTEKEMSHLLDSPISCDTVGPTLCTVLVLEHQSFHLQGKNQALKLESGDPIL
jgi:hypothetical protein